MKDITKTLLERLGRDVLNLERDIASPQPGLGAGDAALLGFSGVFRTIDDILATLPPTGEMSKEDWKEIGAAVTTIAETKAKLGPVQSCISLLANFCAKMEEGTPEKK